MLLRTINKAKKEKVGAKLGDYPYKGGPYHCRHSDSLNLSKEKDKRLRLGGCFLLCLSHKSQKKIQKVKRTQAA